MKKMAMAIGLIVVIAGAFVVGTQRVDECQGSTCVVDMEEIETEEVELSESGRYVEYSELALATARERGRVLLFFKANWCSTCGVLDKEISEQSSEIPEDVTILKVDFDNNKELVKKYQVIIQHTLVQIDKDGNELVKWVGGDLEMIKNKVV